MIFTIYPDSELDQPVRHTLEAGDIAGNVLVYYEADASVTSVAAFVVKGVGPFAYVFHSEPKHFV